MKSIRSFTDEERRRFETRLIELSQQGISVHEAAETLSVEFPEYRIIAKTLWTYIYNHPELNVKFIQKAREGVASVKQQDQKIEDVIHQAAEFIRVHKPLPPIPEHIKATRLEDMGFDTPQEAVALFSDLHYYCVSPNTRILTDDLRWVPAGDLRVGDSIIGFDEMPTDFEREDWPIRRYRRATVTATERRLLPVYEITLENGEKLVSTGEHRWLASYYRTAMRTRWYRTDELAGLSKPPFLLRFVRPWSAPARDYNEGFLAAAFDGEGCLVQPKYGWPTLHFGQKENAFSREVEKALRRKGFPFRRTKNEQSGVCSFHLTGGKDTTLRFLGQIRPPRLLERWQNIDISARRLDAVEKLRIVNVKYVGEQEIVALASSSQTYLAEGFGAHNSRIDRRASNGLAEYNIDIARERLARWRNGVLRFTQISQLVVKLDTLHIFALGDDLEGHGQMFQSQALQMSESIIFQLMGFVEDITEIILSFLERYKKISIVKVPGNHGRVTARARGAYTPDNFETIAWELIAERIRHKTGGEWRTSENGTRHLEGGLIDFHIVYGAIAFADILGWLVAARHGHGVKGLQSTYCVTPETRVLTRDLRWVPAGDLKVGDELIAFDEYPRQVSTRSDRYRRRMLRSAVVTHAERKRAIVYELKLANGDTLRCTGEHKWIVKFPGGTPRWGTDEGWLRTDQIAELLTRTNYPGKHGVRSGKIWLWRGMIPFDAELKTPEEVAAAAYLAGVLDGEGCLKVQGVRLFKRRDWNDIKDKEHGRGFGTIGFVQNDNECLRHAIKCAEILGLKPIVKWGQTRRGKPCAEVSFGVSTLEVLAKVRPPRLMEEFYRKVKIENNFLRPYEYVEVVSCQPIGEQEIAAISSSSATYFAEGYCAHNTGVIDNKLRLNSVIGQVINYLFRAHLHEAQSAEHEIRGEIIQNGCFVGPSLLSIESSRPVANLPSQEFMLFHPRRGKTEHRRIHLADVDEVRKLEVIGREGINNQEDGDHAHIRTGTEVT